MKKRAITDALHREKWNYWCKLSGVLSSVSVIYHMMYIVAVVSYLVHDVIGFF